MIVKQQATKSYPDMAPFIEEPSLELPSVESRDDSLDKSRLLWRERRFLRQAAALGLLAGILVAFLLPIRYESTTRLMPPDSQSNTGMAMLASLIGKTGATGSLGGIAGDLLGMKTSGALFVSVLRSATVGDRLVDKFDLQKIYRKRYREDARKKLAEKTDIEEDRKSGVLSITVTDHDPVRAAALAQAYVDELDRLVAQLSTSAAHRQRVFLEHRLAEVNADLETAEKEFSRFASNNTAIDIKEQGKAMVEAAAVLQGQLIAAEAELEGARQIYTENNVRVKSAEARVSELRNQLQQIGGGDLGTAQPQNGTTDFYPSIRKLPLLGVTYADLYRRTKVDETVFEVLTQQYEMAKVEEAKDTPTVKVLDIATVPEKRSFPPRLLIIFLCTSATVVIAALVTISKVRWHETDPADPRKLFAQEVVQTVNATMPWSPPNGSRVHQFTNQCWSRIARRHGSKERAKHG